MAIVRELVVVDSQDQPAASCVVCGNDIRAGEGVTAEYRGQTLRFKCPGCLPRFEADPDRYLGGEVSDCCGGEHDHSPVSEWRCD